MGHFLLLLPEVAVSGMALSELLWRITDEDDLSKLPKYYVVILQLFICS